MEKTYVITYLTKAFRGDHNLWVKSSVSTVEIKSCDEKIESDIAWLKMALGKQTQILKWEEKK